MAQSGAFAPDFLLLLSGKMEACSMLDDGNRNFKRDFCAIGKVVRETIHWRIKPQLRKGLEYYAQLLDCAASLRYHFGRFLAHVASAF